MSEDSKGQGLIAAIRQRDIEQVCALLDAGFSPDTWDERNIPGLVIAAKEGYTEIVEILLVAGANFSILGIEEPQGIKNEFGGYRRSGAMAIWAAATSGHLNVIKTLKSAMPEMFGDVLSSVCERGCLKALHTLLAVIDVNSYPAYGPLQAACQQGRLDMVHALVNAGIDLNQTDIITEETPLTVAASQGNLDIVKALVVAGALVDQWMGDSSPLICAAYCGRLEVFNYLLPLVPKETQRYAKSTLHKALKRQKRQKNTNVEAFIEGANLGQMDVIQWGIRRGIDINAIGSRNQTALMYATFSGLLEMVKVLLEAGADPDIQSDDDGSDEGTTALMKVASSYTCHFAENAQEMIRLLVTAGANLNLQDNAGKTALIHSVTQGYSVPMAKATQELITLGADLNIRDNASKTALIYAQQQRQQHASFAEIVEQLKMAGATE